MSPINSTRVKAPAPPRPSKSTVVPTTMHDGLVQNPDEVISSDLDKDDLERRFICSKMPCNTSTFNARTLNHITKKEEFLLSSTTKHRCHLSAGKQNPSQRSSDAGKDWCLITCTASTEKNTFNATVRGVGFLLSSRGQKACHEINKISERIVVLTLLGNIQTTVICCYSPTN